MFHINKKFIRELIPNKTILFIFCKSKATHYDVLQLKKDCSSKEIKESYIRLSKLYHPDKTENSGSCHQKFVKINEAYNTLSKPLSRRDYDLELECPRSQVVHSHNYQNHEATPVYEDTIFNRGKAAPPPRDDEYYGVRGIKKQPHFVIVLICMGIAIIGVTIQLSLVKINAMIRRDKIQKDSEANAILLEELRRTTDLNGRELQIELVRKRFEQEELERKKRFG